MKNKSTWLIIISAGLLFLTSITSDNIHFSMKETLYTIMAIAVGYIGINISLDKDN